METNDVSDEFIKVQLEYLKYYESKKNPINNSAEDDYLLALKLMEEEEAQSEKERKARLAAEDEAFAKWVEEQEKQQQPLKPPTPKITPLVISDAEFAAQLAAKERQAVVQHNNNNTVADAQIARLLQEKQELEERLREAEQTPKEAVIDVTSVDYPNYWQPQNSPFQSFDVIKGSEEWNGINYRFTLSLPGNHISRIERIQNKTLWLWYYLKKKELDVKNNLSKGANEKMAFHGSRANAYDIILKDGFDHRVANMGGAYGAGIYFAHNSVTSNGYVAAGTFNKRKMLYCRVLIGDIGPGKSGLRRPPEKSTLKGKTVLYDSVGTDGNIYVVFDDHQCYPEYVIHYH
jgi:poly [ADP-ribose] polymerase 7/11/12/13